MKNNYNVRKREPGTRSISFYKSEVTRKSRQGGQANVVTGAKHLEQVSIVKYLVSMINFNGSCTNETRNGIGNGKTASCQVRNLVTAKTNLIKLRKRFKKCCVWNVVLFSVET